MLVIPIFLACAALPHATAGESPWERMIEESLSAPEPERGKPAPIVKALPAPSSPEQLRELLLALEPRDRHELEALLARHGGALAPFVRLILGDRLAADGEEKEAQANWQKAALAPLLKEEAQRRLANDGRATPDGIVAGLMVPMSGPSAAMGNTLVMAARKAMADHRDVSLQLEVADSGGNAAGAKAAVESLVKRGAQVILGPVFHPEAMAAAKAAKAANVPIIPFNPRAEILSVGGAVQLNAFHPDAQARVMARYAISEAKVKRIAILAADSEYGQLQAQTFANEVVALGGIITHSVLFPDNETDFSNALKMLVSQEPDALKSRLAAARSAMLLDPLDRPPPRTEKELEPVRAFDALFLPTSARQARLIAPQAALFNIRAPETLFLGTSLWNRPELLEEADSLSRAVFCDIDMDAREQFTTLHKKLLGTAPVPALSMLTYDAVAILAQLARDQRLGGLEWQQGLTRESGFHGSAGTVHFHADGVSERYYHVYRVQEKKIVPLATPPQTGAPDPNRSPLAPRGEFLPAAESAEEVVIRDHEPDSPVPAGDSVTVPLPSTKE